MNIWYGYVLTLITTVLLDGLWITGMANRFYRPLLAHLLAPQFTLLPALIFYPVYAAAQYGLVVYPALTDAWPWWRIVTAGLLLGGAAYGAYNCTNQVMLDRWPWLVTVVDMTWGCCATALGAVLSVAILRRS